MQAAQSLSAVGLVTASQPRVAHCQDGEQQQQPWYKCKDDVRWPVLTRVTMATGMINALTIPQRIEVRNTGIFPKCEDVEDLDKAYATVRKRVREELVLSGSDYKPKTEAIRTASMRWAVCLLQHGTVLDKPPHEAGYKNAGERKAVLQKIKDALVAGFPTANGHFYYNNVKEAIARSPDIEAWVTELGFKRPASVWKLLKKIWPELYLGKLIMKKERDHAQTQVCPQTKACRQFPCLPTACHLVHSFPCPKVCAMIGAQHMTSDELHAFVQRCAAEILGEVPVTWPSFYHKYSRKKNPTVHDFQWDECTTVGVDRRQLFDWTAPYHWDPQLAHDQVYLDAWTTDGTQLIKRSTRVIKERGVETKPWENKVSNASIGQVPKFSVYTTAQESVGVTPFFTVHSCTGGRSGGYVGFVTWWDDLARRGKEHIRRFMYYNHPEAQAKLPATWRTDPCTTDHFRVRSLTHQPCHV
jgi:hypothetical protein